jgi:acetone carboxylase gamma subunit
MAILLKLLVDKLGLTNRKEGDKVFCKCGHEFSDVEGKWVCNGMLMCGPCHTELRSSKGVVSYGNQY